MPEALDTLPGLAALLVRGCKLLHNVIIHGEMCRGSCVPLYRRIDCRRVCRVRQHTLCVACGKAGDGLDMYPGTSFHLCQVPLLWALHLHHRLAKGRTPGTGGRQLLRYGKGPPGEGCHGSR